MLQPKNNETSEQNEPTQLDKSKCKGTKQGNTASRAEPEPHTRITSRTTVAILAQACLQCSVPSIMPKRRATPGASSEQPVWAQPGYNAGVAGAAASAQAHSESDEELREPTREEAGDIFGDMLVDLKFSNHLSAKQCCLLAYWATKCQGTGFCEELAMAPETTPGVEGTPDEQTGRWNRHFNRVVRHTQHLQDCYYLDVPYFAKSEAERSARPIPVLHPVAALSRELQATPDLRSLLDRMVSHHELPQSYFQHKVVLDSAPAPVFPLGLYIDGVSFNRRGESTLGITMMNMLTGVQHLIAAARKHIVHLRMPRLVYPVAPLVCYRYGSASVCIGYMANTAPR